jgi:hypothetical protein
MQFESNKKNKILHITKTEYIKLTFMVKLSLFCYLWMMVKI